MSRSEHILQQAIVVDMHSDLPMYVHEQRKNGMRKVMETRFLEDMRAGGLNAIICVIYLGQAELQHPLQSALMQLNAIRQDVFESAEHFAICTTYRQLQKAKESGKIAIMLGFEGLEPIEMEKELLASFYDLGVRFSGLTWSRPNQISDGCSFEAQDPKPKAGLSPFGKEVVPYAEQCGYVLDLTHISERGFWDALEHSTGPVIASHTNTQAVCPIMRNFTDKQIQAIAARGGIIGVNGVSMIVQNNPDDDMLLNFCRHISHIKEIAGIEHIGLGLDIVQRYNLDTSNAASDQLADTIPNYQDLHGLVDLLLQQGYTEEQIIQVLGGNFMRFLESALP